MAKPTAPPPVAAAPSTFSLLGALGLFSTVWSWMSWLFGSVSPKLPARQTWIVILASVAVTYVVLIYGDSLVTKARLVHTVAMGQLHQAMAPAPKPAAKSDPFVPLPALPPPVVPAEATSEARMQALEQRMSDLEAKLAPKGRFLKR